MKVLVTGGAGYVGVKLTEALLDRSYQVTVYDNFMYGCGPILYLVNRPNLTVIKGDIRTDDYDFLKGQDVIFHLAALSGFPICQEHPHEAKMINSLATQRLVNNLGRGQGIIYASTTSIYGKAARRRDETSPVTPISLYGITKYEAEQMVMERGNSIALRFATIFGVSPRMRVNLLANDFTYKAIKERCLVLYESGSTRTFLHIDDAVAAYIMALESFDTMKNEVYNIGDEDLNFSKMEIAQAIHKFVDFDVIDSGIKDSDPRDFAVDFTKIRRLGFSATVSLEQGIQELVKLYGFYDVSPIGRAVW